MSIRSVFTLALTLVVAGCGTLPPPTPAFPDGELLRLPVTYPSANLPGEVRVLRVTIEPGQRTGWHTHPYRVIAYVLEGQLEVTEADGTVHKLKAGDATLELEVLHQGYNPGTTPTHVIAVFMGVSGAPFQKAAVPPVAGE